MGLRTGLIARPKLEKFPCLFLLGPGDAQVPLRVGIEEGIRHFVHRDVFLNALHVQADAADIVGNGNQGDVVALRDGDAEDLNDAISGSEIADLFSTDVVS